MQKSSWWLRSRWENSGKPSDETALPRSRQPEGSQLPSFIIPTVILHIFPYPGLLHSYNPLRLTETSHRLPFRNTRHAHDRGMYMHTIRSVIQIPASLSYFFFIIPSCRANPWRIGLFDRVLITFSEKMTTPTGRACHRACA